MRLWNKKLVELTGLLRAAGSFFFFFSSGLAADSVFFGTSGSKPGKKPGKSNIPLLLLKIAKGTGLGLSQGAEGQGFPSITMSMTPSYFHKKQKKIEPRTPYFKNLLPTNTQQLEILVTALNWAEMILLILFIFSCKNVGSKIQAL